MTEPTVLIETVSKLELKDGDILHVKLGGDVEDTVWIPDPDDIEFWAKEWRHAVEAAGLAVVVIVTHHLANAEVIRDAREEAS